MLVVGVSPPTTTGAEHRLVFHQPRITVGSAPDCDIVLPDATVSSRHCVLSGHAGQYALVDLMSLHGTILNGQRVTGVNPVRVGDQISVGAFVVRVLEMGAPPSAGGKTSNRSGLAKAMLVHSVVIVALMLMSVLFGFQGIGTDRGFWDGVQGRVADKGSSTHSRVQHLWVNLDTVHGRRKVYVGNAVMAGCSRGDVFRREPQSFSVTCGRSNWVDWGGIGYLLAAALCFGLSGMALVAGILRLRDERR